MLDDRKSWFENRGHWLSGMAAVAVLLGSCVLSRYNFLLFHTLLEIFSFVVAWMVFVIFWNTRRLQDNDFYLFIAIACAIVSVNFQGSLKVLAHLSQLASLYFLYKVFIEWGIREPSSLLFRDLTRSEIDLRKDRDFMDALLQTTNALVVVLDTQGRIVRFNRTCETISGYSAEEIAGEYVCDYLLLPEEREDLRSLIEEHGAGRLHSHHENYWINKTGDRQLIAWSNTVIKDTSGAVEYIVCTGIDITERKRYEVALHASEERFLNIFHASREAILLLDGEKFIECNEAVCRMLGYSNRNDFLMVHPSKLSPPIQPDGRESFEKAEEMIKTAIKKGFHSFEWVHRKASGEDFFVEVSLTPITLQGKNILQSHWRDITELKRAEVEIREKDRRLQLFAENIDDVLWTANSLGQFSYVSSSIERVLGYSPEEFIRLTFDRFMQPSSAKKAADSLIESFALVQTGQPVRPVVLELEFYRKNGDRFWGEVTYNGMYDEAGKFICMQGITRDITERKRAEQRQLDMIKRMEGLHFLQEALLLPGTLEDKLNFITDESIDLLDLDFCRIWMVKPGDLCDSGCIHATKSDENNRCPKHEKCLHLLASSGRYTHLDGDHRRVPLGCYKIGKIATGEVNKYLTNHVTTDPCVHNHEWASSLGLVSFAGYKLLNMRDKPTGVMAMFAKHPLSAEDDAFLGNLARKTSKLIIDHYTEEELRQAQKLEGVGQLAGGVAHEFNNLLQVITGFTRCGMKGLDPEEERYHDYQHVLEAADRAAALTQQLLGFGRRKAIQPKHIDANQVVRDLIQIVRPTIGKLIIVNELLGDDVGMVYADAVDLQQALLNLCLNARDSMPAGGILTIKTEKIIIDHSDQVSQFEIQPGSYVIFSVSDMGCGISTQNQQHIFEPFFSTKEVGKGTGLGLSMVYGMVQQHQGAIQVESEVGKGTSIKLYMPSDADPILEKSEVANGLICLEPDSFPVAENVPMTTGLDADIFGKLLEL